MGSAGFALPLLGRAWLNRRPCAQSNGSDGLLDGFRQRRVEIDRTVKCERCKAKRLAFLIGVVMDRLDGALVPALLKGHHVVGSEELTDVT